MRVKKGARPPSMMDQHVPGEREFKQALLIRNVGLIKTHRQEIKELAKEKNDAQRKQIMESTSQQGNVEGEPSIQEPYHPLTLLPEEMWMLVFKSGPLDTKDLLNCYHTCNLFHNALNDTIGKRLFEEIFPFVLPLLDTPDILNCRQVCANWKSGIDAFLGQDEKELYLRSSQGDCRGTLLLNRINHDGIVGPYKFHLPANTQSSNGLRNHNGVCEQLRMHGQNPLIVHKVEILLKDPLVEACSEAEQILDDLGQYFHHLSLSCLSASADVVRFFLVCMQSLEKCPNLKSLTMQAQFGPTLNLSEINEAAENRRNLDGVAPLLEAIHFNSFNGGASILHWVLERTFMKDLSCCLKNITTHNWRSLEQKFENLTQITVSSPSYPNTLDNMLSLNMPGLQKLNIMWSSQHFWFNKLVQVVRHFKTLRFLILKTDGEGRTSGNIFLNQHQRMDFFSSPYYVMPPTLTTLSIEGEHCFYHFDFLLFFPFLRDLGIQSTTYPEAEGMARNGGRPSATPIAIDIGATLMKQNRDHCIREIRTSNIWEHLPLLQQLYVSVADVQRTFRRREYDYYSKCGGDNEN